MANEYKIAIHIAGKLEQSLGNAVNGANKTLSGLGKKGTGVLGVINKGLGGLLKGTGAFYGATGAAMGMAAKNAVSVGREYESALATAAATGGIEKGSADWQKLDQAAQNAGMTTSKTAAESATALEKLLLAGWGVEGATSSLEDLLHVSEATGLGLEETASGMTKSMGAMGYGYKDLEHFSNVLTKAQNNSGTTLEWQMDAMKKAGGTMHMLGINVEDTATMIGLLADKGKDSAQAGTALNAIFKRMSQPTGQSAKAMEALGLSIYDSEHNFKGAGQVLTELHDRLNSLNQEEKDQYLNLIGGQYGAVLEGLLANFDPIENELGETTTKWEELNSKIYDSDGAVEQMRNTKLDTLNGDIDSLTSALEALEIKFSQAMSGKLRETVQWLVEKVRELSTVFEEGGFDKFAETLGTSLADAAVKAAEEAPKIIKSVGTVADEIVKAFGSEDTAGKLAVGATTIIDTLSTELFTLAGDIADSALNLLDEFINAFAAEDGVGKLAEGASKLLDGIAEGIDQHGESIASAATKIVTQLAEALPGLTESYGGMVLTIITELSNAFSTHGAEIGEAAGVMIGKLAVGFVEHLPEIVNSGIAIIGGILVGLLQAGGALVAAAPEIFYDLWDAIKNIDWLDLGMQIVKGIWNGITTLWSSFVDWLGNLATNETPTVDNSGNQLAEGWYFNGGADGGENYYNELEDKYYTAEAAQEAGAFISAMEEAGAATTEADKAYENARKTMEQTGESVDHTSKALDTYKSVIDETKAASLEDVGITTPETDTSEAGGSLDALLAQSSEVITQIQEQGTEAGEGFSTNLDTSMQGAVTAAQTTATSITSQFNGLYFEMISIGIHIGEGLVEGMNAMIAQVQASAANLANAASDAIAAAAQVHSPSDITTEIGEYIGEGLPVGMKKSLSGVTAAAGELGRAATNRSAILGGMSVNRGMGGGGSINFSPVINLSGTNLTQGDVRNAMKMSMAEFEKLMAQYQKKRGRVAFA